MGADGEDKTVGFRLGKYKGGSCAVVGPAEMCHVSAETKRVVSEFQKFIRFYFYIHHLGCERVQSVWSIPEFRQKPKHE